MLPLYDECTISLLIEDHSRRVRNGEPAQDQTIRKNQMSLRLVSLSLFLCRKVTPALGYHAKSRPMHEDGGGWDELTVLISARPSSEL